jgi:hypothetical protein
VSHLLSLLSPAGQALAGHLGHLSAGLLDAGRRLREAVAGAVGQTAARAFRQAVAALLRRPGEGPEPAEVYSSRRDVRPLHGWEGSGHLDRFDRPNQLDRWGQPEEERWRPGERDWLRDEPDEPEEPCSDEEAPACSGPSSWRAFLAACCQFVAWWLRRLAGRRPLLGAVSVGLTTALAVWLAGPWAGPGAVLALAALTDALALGTAALAGA